MNYVIFVEDMDGDVVGTPEEAGEAVAHAMQHGAYRVSVRKWPSTTKERAEVSNNEIDVTFNPKPKGEMRLPRSIRIGDRTVGMLTGYRAEEGIGRAILDENLTMPELNQLSIGDYGFLGLTLKPDMLHACLPPDEQRIRAVLKVCPIGYDEDAQVRYVMTNFKGAANPVEVRRIVKIINEKG